MTPQPTPSSTPSPTPAPTSGTVAGITINVPTKSNTSKADLYGLGAWGTQTVNPGDLPFLTSIMAAGQNTTGDDVMKAFLAANPAEVAQIQQALVLGGYYGSTYTPTWGVLKPEDTAAFAKAMVSSGQQNQPVSQVLLAGAKYGQQAGVAAAQAAQQTVVSPYVTVKQVNMPNEQDLEAAGIKAFEAELGRKAKPDEAAAFGAAYRAMSAGVQRQANQGLYDAQVQAYQQRTVAKQDAKTTGKAAGDVLDVPSGPVAPPEIGHFGGPLSAEDRQNFTASQTTPAAGFSQQMMSIGQAISQAQQSSTQQPVSLQPLENVTQENPVSADVAAANYARNTHPQEAAANDTANVFDTFLNLITKHFG